MKSTVSIFFKNLIKRQFTYQLKYNFTWPNLMTKKRIKLKNLRNQSSLCSLLLFFLNSNFFVYTLLISSLSYESKEINSSCIETKVNTCSSV